MPRALSGHDGGLHAIVAVKSLRTAKSRLASELDPDARTDLVLAMLHDTLTTVAAVRSIDAVTVVTPDPNVAALACSIGVNVYADPGPLPGEADPSQPDTRLNAALTAAAAHVRSHHGAVDLVVLQADLPALRSAELSEAVQIARSGGRSIVVDHHGTGTSALFSIGKGNALDPRFGPESARGHLNSGARQLGGHWPGLRTDVDTPADLDAVRALGVGPSTAAALTRLAAATSNTR